MPSKRNFHLDADELALIDAALSTPSRPEVKQRAQAIRLLHQGQSLLATATALTVSQGTIKRWHRRWREGGIDTLVSRRGRPPVGIDYQHMLVAALEKAPSELGIQGDHWTVRSLSEYLYSAGGVHIGETRLRALLHQLGYHYDEKARQVAILITEKPQSHEALAAWLTEMADRLPDLLARTGRWRRVLP